MYVWYKETNSAVGPWKGSVLWCSLHNALGKEDQLIISLKGQTIERGTH